MPNPYRRIWETNGQNVATPALALPPELMPPAPRDACNGATILEIARARSAAPTTFQSLLEAFIQFGKSAANRWKWNGRAGGWNRFGLLDGTRTEGECKLFAANLWLLARAPAPLYGLGVGAADLPEVVIYEGGGGHGFVAEHDGIFFGLDSDVVRAPGYNGVRLYLWTNHKVLCYRNEYYDACYGKRYRRLPDMATYELTGRTFRLRNDTPDNCRQTGDTAEEAAHRGSIFFFRKLSREEEILTRKRYIGPLDERQAHARHGFLHE